MEKGKKREKNKPKGKSSTKAMIPRILPIIALWLTSLWYAYNVGQDIKEGTNETMKADLQFADRQLNFSKDKEYPLAEKTIEHLSNRIDASDKLLMIYEEEKQKLTKEKESLGQKIEEFNKKEQIQKVGLRLRNVLTLFKNFQLASTGEEWKRALEARQKYFEQSPHPEDKDFCDFAIKVWLAEEKGIPIQKEACMAVAMRDQSIKNPMTIPTNPTKLKESSLKMSGFALKAISCINQSIDKHDPDLIKKVPSSEWFKNRKTRLTETEEGIDYILSFLSLVMGTGMPSTNIQQGKQRPETLADIIGKIEQKPTTKNKK